MINVPKLSSEKQQIMKTPRIHFSAAALAVGALALNIAISSCGTPMPRYPSEAYTPAGAQSPLSEYAGRRQRLMDQIGQGVAVIAGATEPMASVQFWQNNDFFYFTGVEVPGAFLVIDGVARESALFFHLTEKEARGEGIPLELLHDPMAATGIERVGTTKIK